MRLKNGFSKPDVGQSTFRRIADNAISLLALQGVTYVIQFFTFPYLLRTLGTKQFGAIAFASSVMAQLILLTDFGFNASATRQIAINRDDESKVNSIFSSVMGVKLVLLIISALSTVALALCAHKFRAQAPLFAVVFSQVIGSVLFPYWLFQGMERMRLISAISLIARLVTTGLIFLVIHHPEDYILAAGCQSLGILLQGLIAVWYVLTVMKIRFIPPSLDALWWQVKDSIHAFYAAAMGNLIGGSSVLFLGFFKDLNIVGSYAAIERVARAEVLLLMPIMQAVYPHISQRFYHGRNTGNQAIFKFALLFLSGSTILLAAVSIFSKQILRLLYGQKLLFQAPLFSTFSLWALLSLANTLMGLHYLIASGHSKEYGKSVFWSALLTVFLFVILIPGLDGWGALTGVIAGEILQAAMMLHFIFTINRKSTQPTQTSMP
jgi:polysaccharide transporter, PST family